MTDTNDLLMRDIERATPLHRSICEMVLAMHSEKRLQLIRAFVVKLFSGV